MTPPRPTSPHQGPLLELRGLTRTFGPVTALDGVSFTVSRGEVLGLIGENGAGKSTILNIISGTDSPDGGEVLVRGESVAYRNYHDAAKDGVFRVFQELGLVQNLRVWENLFLGHEDLFLVGPFLRRRAAIKRAKTIFARFDYAWIDVERQVSSYPFAVQQLIEVMRAFALAELLGHEDPIVLLDEPTAALAANEVEFLRGLVDRIRSYSAVVFVSHHLAELLSWSDRIVVLKDGRLVAEGSPTEIDEGRLHFLMVGRERNREFYREDRQREPSDVSVLEVRGASDGESFRNVSFRLAEGEILGIAGVLGSGKAELARAIFGARKLAQGEIHVRGRKVARIKLRRMAGLGVGYVSPERKFDGMVDTFSVQHNITIAKIAIKGRAILRLTQEMREARSLFGELRVKAASPRASILSLSGGNQQKVILARWLAAGADILVLDNPTRGVDAGAKEEIYGLLRDLCAHGKSLVVVSDDLLEVIGLANRILVMKSGEITAEFDARAEAKPGEESLVAAMV